MKASVPPKKKKNTVSWTEIRTGSRCINHLGESPCCQKWVVFPNGQRICDTCRTFVTVVHCSATYCRYWDIHQTGSFFMISGMELRAGTQSHLHKHVILPCGAPHVLQSLHKELTELHESDLHENLHYSQNSKSYFFCVNTATAIGEDGLCVRKLSAKECQVAQ